MKLRYLKNVTTLELDPDRCTGCGACLEVCPHQLFALENGRSVILDRDGCMECGACARNCPTGAVSVQPGVGCAYAVLNSGRKGGTPCCGEQGGCCS